MTNFIQGQTKIATANFTDANLVARPVFGVPVWSATPAVQVTLAPAADGLSCAVTFAALGVFNLIVSCEADPTVGVNTITGEFTGNIVAAEDTEVTITFGDAPPTPATAAQAAPVVETQTPPAPAASAA